MLKKTFLFLQKEQFWLSMTFGRSRKQPEFYIPKVITFLIVRPKLSWNSKGKTSLIQLLTLLIYAPKYLFSEDFLKSSKEVLPSSHLYKLLDFRWWFDNLQGKANSFFLNWTRRSTSLNFFGCENRKGMISKSKRAVIDRQKRIFEKYFKLKEFFNQKFLFQIEVSLKFWSFKRISFSMNKNALFKDIISQNLILDENALWTIFFKARFFGICWDSIHPRNYI